MIQLLDENDKAQIEQKIKTVSDETNSLKEDLDNVFNLNLNENITKEYIFTDSNVDFTCESSGVFSPIVCININSGTYKTALTVFALQYKENYNDGWTDIKRLYSDKEGNFVGYTNEFAMIPSKAKYIRIVSHNNSENYVSVKRYYANNNLKANYNILAETSFEKMGDDFKESIAEFHRINMLKGKTYNIAIYSDIDDFNSTITILGVRLFEKQTDNTSILICRDRIAENECTLIPKTWNFFTVIPDRNINFVQLYISGIVNTNDKANIMFAVEDMDKYPVGYLESYATINGKFLKETSPKLYSTKVGGGNAIQGMKRISNDRFIIFASPDSTGNSGIVSIIKNHGFINNGIDADYMNYYHAEFLHIINTSHLKNGNLLVSSKIADGNRPTYEYNYETDEIVNTWETPKTNEDGNLSQFVIPVSGNTEKLYVGYCENIEYPNSALMKVYEYTTDTGVMTKIAEFDYLPKYTQDTCVYNNALYIMGNDGYGSDTSFITIVDLKTWKIVGVITISNTQEMEGIDVECVGDKVLCYTSGNNDYHFIRTFLLN